MDQAGSLAQVRASPLLRGASVQLIEGPTQLTLRAYAPEAPLDAVLLDGPHGYPFPELEYYAVYPHLRTGALLIIDDLVIPTVKHMYSILRVDDMFDEIVVVGNTGFLRRTAAPTFDPLGDGHWLQGYNRRLPIRARLRGNLPPALKRIARPSVEKLRAVRVGRRIRRE
jgi:hypothetical protein